MATIMLFYKLYNPDLSTCSNTGYPNDCESNPDVDCIRGEKTFLFRIIFTFVPNILVFAIVFVSLILLVLAVWKQDKAMSRYSKRWGQQRNNRNTKIAFRKACLYIVSYLITAVPITVILFMDNLIGGANVPFGWVLATNITLPLQGFLNAVAYSSLFGKMSPIADNSVRSLSTLARRVSDLAGSMKRGASNHPDSNVLTIEKSCKETGAGHDRRHDLHEEPLDEEACFDTPRNNDSGDSSRSSDNLPDGLPLRSLSGHDSSADLRGSESGNGSATGSSTESIHEDTEPSFI